MEHLLSELHAALERSTSATTVREHARRALTTVREQFTAIRSLPPDERRTAGQALNRTKQQIEQMLADRLETLQNEPAVYASQRAPTLPTRPLRIGRVHPTVALLRRMHGFFSALGFVVVDGPEIESDWYNFAALNLPAEHPAREWNRRRSVFDDGTCRPEW